MTTSPFASLQISPMMKPQMTYDRCVRYEVCVITATADCAAIRRIRELEVAAATTPAISSGCPRRVQVLTVAVQSLAAEDLPAVEKLIREADTWALVDGLACSVAGGIALRDPSSWTLIDAWASDQELWVRRSALLALLPGIRAGRPDLPPLTAYAELMLVEKEFFIRKAIGWVLREICQRNPRWAAEWTEGHISEISGVTFREAVRRLPEDDADRLRSLRRPGSR